MLQMKKIRPHKRDVIHNMITNFRFKNSLVLLFLLFSCMVRSFKKLLSSLCEEGEYQLGINQSQSETKKYMYTVFLLNNNHGTNQGHPTRIEFKTT